MICNTHKLVLSALLLAITACSSNPPAPVTDRLPTNASNKTSTASGTSTAKSQSKSPTSKPTYKAGDWRPDTYVVKKGDTLFSIGLEHGYDYKEIAQANGIEAPYGIRAGQSLKLSSLKDKSTPNENTANQTNSDGVFITPINTESSSSTASSNAAAASTAATNTASSVAPSVLAINEPKAIREPYSEEALKKPLPIAKPAITKPATDKTTLVTTTNNTANKPSIEPKPDSAVPDDMVWAWPTKGKVTANFNEGGNKGIDIAGNTGQAINAAAAGKVIYSGSDLRGYGKLVIIKHNASYLSVYAHNSQILVKEGQQVSSGQKIAEMGNTDSNTVKLHFEIRRQGKSIDPSKYLASN